MKTVNVHEAKTNFSRLLATVEDSSESFVICRNGEPD
jgi:antitoxin (DNA-binding transcriptional repressor) of toxin-antitoxin stability system